MLNCKYVAKKMDIVSFKTIYNDRIEKHKPYPSQFEKELNSYKLI